MPDSFDPYREGLVVEQRTNWPADCEVPQDRREAIERSLHNDAASCSHLEYVRVHTGFCRTITVTAADLQRVGASV